MASTPSDDRPSTEPAATSRFARFTSFLGVGRRSARLERLPERSRQDADAYSLRSGL